MIKIKDNYFYYFLDKKILIAFKYIKKIFIYLKNIYLHFRYFLIDFVIYIRYLPFFPIYITNKCFF
jgi:hypothetical protein